jgi:type I restriction enzyme S subunit
MTQAKEATDPASKPLPAGWKWAKVGEVCDLIGGGTPSKSVESYYSGNIPWATVRDMSEDVLAITEHRITKEAVSASATHVIPKGNVVIATRVGLGKVCLLAQDTAINQDLKGVLPHKNSNLDVGYLFHWFKSVSDQIMRQGTGATVLGVKLPFIESLKIPIPPLAEQKRIAAKINDQMAAVEKARAAAEAQLEAAKALPAAYLRQVFPSPGQPLPAGWKWRTFKEVSSVVGGSTPDTGNSKYWDGEIIWITPTDLGKASDIYINSSIRKITQLGYDNSGTEMLPLGSIVMSSRAPIGYLGIVAVPLCTNQGCKSFVPGRDLDSMFLFWSLKTVVPVLKQLGSGATFAEVSKSLLEDYPIAMPSLNEQKALALKLTAQISAANKLCSLLEQQLRQINSLPDFILRKAFSGEL